MIDYDAVVYAGADLLQLVDDGARRKVLDAWLLQQGPLVEQRMRELIEGLVNEINSQLPTRFTVRVVHEDTEDFVEVDRRTYGNESRAVIDEDLLGIAYLLEGRFGVASEEAARLAQGLLDAASAAAGPDPNGE